MIRFREENPHWGYTRIQDYIVHLGYKIGQTTVKNTLIENGYDPEPDLIRKTTWREFLQSHWNVLAACDFFSVELLVKGNLIRCMVLFAMDLATRKVEILNRRHTDFQSATRLITPLLKMTYKRFCGNNEGFKWLTSE